MDDIGKVQEIGNLVCENCDEDRDCGFDPKDCIRIISALEVLRQS